MTTKKPKPKTPKAPLDPAEAQGQAQNKALSSLYGQEGVDAGNALISKFLPQGTLGRVNTNVPGATQDLQRYNDLYSKATAGDPNQAGVLQQMQSGLAGYSSPEYQAQREQMEKGVDSNYATAQNQLAKVQARSKVYGAAGAAQQANLLTSTQNSKNDLEQQLMVKDIDERQKRLQDYGSYSEGITNDVAARSLNTANAYSKEQQDLNAQELDREKTNLGQANAETAAQIGAFTGAGGTSLTKAQQKAMNRIQQQGIQAFSRL